MSNEDRRLLAQIRATLCRIEVRGEENLNSLLGCIQAIDRLTAKEEAGPDAGE